MATDRRPVRLPTVCAGPFSDADEARECPNPATHVLVTVLPGPTGGPMPVLVGACRWHLADVRLWLELQSIGDPIDAYPVAGFPMQLLDDAGMDWHVLVPRAS